MEEQLAFIDNISNYTSEAVTQWQAAGYNEYIFCFIILFNSSARPL